MRYFSSIVWIGIHISADARFSDIVEVHTMHDIHIAQNLCHEHSSYPESWRSLTQKNEEYGRHTFHKTLDDCMNLQNTYRCLFTRFAFCATRCITQTNPPVLVLSVRYSRHISIRTDVTWYEYWLRCLIDDIKARQLTKQNRVRYLAKRDKFTKTRHVHHSTGHVCLCCL